MTLEMQEALTRQLNDAVESGDNHRVLQAYANIMISMMDCQRKTAERVKQLKWRFFALVASLSGVAGFTVDKFDIFNHLFH